MSYKEINPIIDEWLINYPDESHDTLSSFLRSGQVVLKKNVLSSIPKLSPFEAIKLIEEIKQSSTLKITDLKYNLKEYKNCFIGSEFIDWLKEHKDLITEEALLLGKHLFTLNLIEHTKKEHGFENEYLFYHFTLPKQKLIKTMDTTSIRSPSSILLEKYKMSYKEINPIIDEWLINYPDESHDTLSSFLRSGQVVLKKNVLSSIPKLSPFEAIKLIEEIKQSNTLKITDQKYNLKEYKNCFIGSELIDWLKEHKDLITEEALLLGKHLFTLNLIRHTKKEHEFENEYLFYHFTIPKMDFLISPRETIELIQELKKSDSLEIKDRTHNLKVYPQSFLGSDLVSWLEKNKNMATIEAISLGKELVRNKRLSHVTNDHDFKNEGLFYQFGCLD